MLTQEDAVWHQAQADPWGPISDVGPVNLGGLLGLCPLGGRDQGREHQGWRVSICQTSCLVTQGRKRLEKRQIPAKMQVRPRPPPLPW